MANQITGFLGRNREGIIIGGIAGWLIGKFFIPSDFDFSVITQTQGILDPFISAGKSAIELAKTKVIWGTTIIGATLGAVLDEITPEGRFFKRRMG